MEPPQQSRGFGHVCEKPLYIYIHTQPYIHNYDWFVTAALIIIAWWGVTDIMTDGSAASPCFGSRTWACTPAAVSRVRRTLQWPETSPAWRSRANVVVRLSWWWSWLAPSSYSSTYSALLSLAASEAGAVILCMTEATRLARTATTTGVSWTETRGGMM